MDDRGDNAIQVHEAFQHRAVYRSRGVIYDDSNSAITAEILADDQLGLLLPTSGPPDLRHRRIVPPEPSGAHPLIGAPESVSTEAVLAASIGGEDARSRLRIGYVR